MRLFCECQNIESNRAEKRNSAIKMWAKSLMMGLDVFTFLVIQVFVSTTSDCTSTYWWENAFRNNSRLGKIGSDQLKNRRHHVWRKDITEMTKCLCVEKNKETIHRMLIRNSPLGRRTESCQNVPNWQSMLFYGVIPNKTTWHMHSQFAQTWSSIGTCSFPFGYVSEATWY